jgi:hypothetical protein
LQPSAFGHRRVRHRWLASLATATLAFSACGGVSVSAGGLVSATGSPVSGLASAPEGTPPTPTATVAPSSEALPVLAKRWRCGGTTTSQPSFQPLAVDPRNGDVWAAVPFDNLFWICDATGKYLESWGTAGSGDGQFDLNDHLQNPDGFGAIAFAPDGSFFVGDVGNHRIEKFDAKRRFVRKWGSFGYGGGKFGQITAVATDGTTVLVGDSGDIQAFDLSGTYLRRFGSDGSFSAFVAIDRGGNAYASNPSTPNPAVAKFDPSGKEISRFDFKSIGDAVGVAVAPNGHVFAGAASTTAPYPGIGTWELDSDLRRLRGWLTGGGGYLALSPNAGTLYVSGWNAWPDVVAYAIPKG